jgi:hypothetical protein
LRQHLLRKFLHSSTEPMAPFFNGAGMRLGRASYTRKDNFNLKDLLMTDVTLNSSQALFVLHHGPGVSALGFDVVAKRIRQYAALLGRTIAPVAHGSLEQYHAYKALEAAVAARKFPQVIYDADTPYDVQRVLERCRIARLHVRIFYGDPQTGLDSLSTFNVIGRVGNTMGPIRAPLLVPRGADCGDIISSSRVLKIVHVVNGRILYQHARYHLPSLQVRTSTVTATTPKALSKYPVLVAIASKRASDNLEEKDILARFKTQAKAERYLAFITGIRHTR